MCRPLGPIPRVGASVHLCGGDNKTAAPARTEDGSCQAEAGDLKFEPRKNAGHLSTETNIDFHGHNGSMICVLSWKVFASTLFPFCARQNMFYKQDNIIARFAAKPSL